MGIDAMFSKTIKDEPIAFSQRLYTVEAFTCLFFQSEYDMYVIRDVVFKRSSRKSSRWNGLNV